MGVLEPLVEAFEDEVPATPPGIRDLGLDTDDNSEDDLFAEPPKEEKPAVIKFENDLSFKNILPVLSLKGDFGNLLDMEERKLKWDLQTPTKKKPKYCSGCVDDVKKDLNRLANIVEDYKNERDTVRAENEALKKEVEELKKLLRQKEELERGDVQVTISNSKEENVDILVRKKNFENARNLFDKSGNYRNNSSDPVSRSGVQSFSINLLNQTSQLDSKSSEENRSKKTVAELRREFFEREFQSEQKTFTSRNYLEIKPTEEKKNFIRSRLNIKIKPKQKINEIISKLTSKFGGSKVVPESPKITMFQRFEKTKVVWQNDFEGKVLA